MREFVEIRDPDRSWDVSEYLEAQNRFHKGYYFQLNVRPINFHMKESLKHIANQSVL